MRSPWRLLAVVLGSLLLAAAAPSPLSAAEPGPIRSVAVSGSPFYPNGDGIRELVTFSVRLRQAAVLRVEVVDFDGGLVRVLLSGGSRPAGTHVFDWKGRDVAGLRVADGPYLLRAIATAGGEQSVAEAPFTKAPKVIYKARPGAIVVTVDPGHGDVYSEPGRYAPDGTHESEINLDIGLRLAAMLEGAGVRVVLTRTTQVGANTPEWDRNGDGLIGYDDELAARPDAANVGRSDVFISIHNNLATNTRVGGPSVYYRQDRPFHTESYRLAQAVYSNMVARLDLYRTDTWKPSRSHGILSHYPYYVLSPYSPPNLVRPTLMPGVLSEGLFLTHPYELYLLKQARVRQSMAAAYYDAVQRYVAERPYAAAYKPRSQPLSAVAGAGVEYGVRIINRGMQAAAGWTLEGRLVPAVPLYDGSGQPGELIASAAVPTLGRGGRADVTLTGTVPAGGEYIVKFDVRMADGRYLSDLGSPVLQLPISVAAAP